MKQSCRIASVIAFGTFCTFGAVIIVVLGCFGILSSNEWRLRNNSEAIRADLLKETPLGTSRSNVKAHLKSQGCYVERHDTSRGYYNYDSGEVVGTRSLCARLGSYTLFPLLVTTVEAYYAFDDNDRLIDVWVRKTTDGP